MMEYGMGMDNKNDLAIVIHCPKTINHPLLGTSILTCINPYTDSICPEQHVDIWWGCRHKIAIMVTFQLVSIHPSHYRYIASTIHHSCTLQYIHTDMEEQGWLLWNLIKRFFSYLCECKQGKWFLVIILDLLKGAPQNINYSLNRFPKWWIFHWETRKSP